MMRNDMVQISWQVLTEVASTFRPTEELGKARASQGEGRSLGGLAS